MDVYVNTTADFKCRCFCNRSVGARADVSVDGGLDGGLTRKLDGNMGNPDLDRVGSVPFAFVLCTVK